MSKYHILKNTNDYNADTDNLIEISTTTSTSNTHTASLTPLTDNEIFNHISDHSSHNHCDSDDELFYRSRNHNREPVISGNHYTDDLIEYSNKENNNCSDKILNQQKNIYNDNNTILATGKKHKTKQFNSTFNSVNATFAVTAADTCDDTIMEIPLLQPNNMNENGTGNNGDITKNYNNKQHHQYDFECVCLCQQRGFASHLNSNSTQTAKSKILWAIALCCIFMIVEFLGGYIAGSLAIMTDAAHLASDCISFIIGLVAIWLGTRPPDAKMSFGYKRFEVMGAIVSILGIWILTATLVLVAIQRIYSNDYDLDANTMMTISGIGILINIIMIFILHTSILDLPSGNIGGSHCHSHSHSHSHSQSHNSHHGHSQGNIHAHTTTLLHRRRHSNDNDHMHTDISTRSLLPTNSDAESDGVVAIPSAAIDTDEATSIELSSAPILFNGNLSKHQQDGNEKNLNLRAAMIHVIGDLVQSIGVFVASVLIKIFPKAVFLDPLCTLFFSVIVIMTTINLFKESMHLIMDAVPKGISLDDLEMDLLKIEGVKSVHHLNVWDHTSNYSILMVHLVTDILTEGNTILMKATQLAGSSKYNIKHSTIQIETMTS